ncbi:unnamed protein product [Rangifer tarandus platyrhynchus]|uniref:Uncharacterized protein n=2 Tax=Rangifer tarandus platyrhynchus TaxID=3082113 RepID=A0ACB0DX94_RANTA|nr:unnamed protein product [Rangifer tarandus platyrhynchus]CAI9692948.1 unnamed protein product [Rangifer tarandus platyrhynchus]
MRGAFSGQQASPRYSLSRGTGPGQTPPWARRDLGPGEGLCCAWPQAGWGGGGGVLRRPEAERGNAGSDGPAAVRLAAMEASERPGESRSGPRRQGSGTRQPARRSARGLGNRETSAPRRWRPRRFQFSLRPLVTV